MFLIMWAIYYQWSLLDWLFLYFFLYQVSYIFINVRFFNKDSYISKTKKRIRTLLIPYIFWNLFALILFFIAENTPYISDLFSGKNLKVSHFGIQNFVRAFWAPVDGNTPFVYPFWFIRVLFIVCIFSPLIYLLVKYTKIAGIVIVGIYWFLDIKQIVGFSSASLFFFTLGAYLSIYRYNLIEVSNKFFIFLLLLTL